MDENLSRAVREVFVRLYEQGLIYRGKYIVNWCRLRHGHLDLEVKHEDARHSTKSATQSLAATSSSDVPRVRKPCSATPPLPSTRRTSVIRIFTAKLLPLMNREIPIITDDLAQRVWYGRRESHASARRQRLQAGLRHNLPQIEVIDEQ
jgi:valyl-tRNA synthetase